MCYDRRRTRETFETYISCPRAGPANFRGGGAGTRPDQRSTKNMALTLDTETITPAKAEEYLAKNHCNRPVSRTDVDRYKRLINEGLFEMTHQGIGLDAR